jgi:dienelactone hydrolase
MAEHILATLGTPPPTVPPLAPETLRMWRTAEGIEWRKVRFQTEPGEFIPAYLLVPSRTERQLPALVVLHQTVPQGKDEVVGIHGDPEQAYALDLARRGYVVLAPDSLAAGERVGKGEEPWDTAPFYQRHPGWSAVGKAVWDGQRAVDYLVSLPFVDRKRIGVIGHSQGGIYATFLAAFDPRVKVVVSSCGLMTFAGDPTRPLRWARDQGWIGIPALREPLQHGAPPWDFHQLVALIAPRPFLATAATEDRIMPHAAPALEVLARAVHPLYAAYRMPDRFKVSVFPGPHAFPPAEQERAFIWLDRFLKAPRLEIEVGAAVTKMLAAHSEGAMTDSSYFAAVSADSLAHYALAHFWAAEGLSRPELTDKGAQLLKQAKESAIVGSGWTGWGLGAPWDAFQDGSMNSASTVYTYTTARIGLALLEAYRSGKAPWALEEAHRATRSLVEQAGYNRFPQGIAFRYSDADTDRPYTVHNVNAATAQFLLDWQSVSGDQRYRNLVRRSFDYLISQQDPDGQWAYRLGSTGRNDTVHHALIVEALYDCARKLPKGSCRVAADRALTVLMEHFVDSNGAITDLGENLPLALGGVLIALQSGCEAGSDYTDPACAWRDAIVQRALTHDYNPEGYFYNNHNPRAQGWIAAGLARVLAGLQVEKR